MPKEHKLFWSCYMSNSQFIEVVEFSAYLVKHSSLFETVFFFRRKKKTIMLVDFSSEKLKSIIRQTRMLFLYNVGRYLILPIAKIFYC